MSDLILYQFSRDRVEAGDARDFLTGLARSVFTWASSSRE